MTAPAVTRASRSCEDILADARRLEANNADGISALVAEAAELEPLKRDLVLKAIKEQTGLGIGALREQARYGFSRDEPDQLDLARMVLAALDPANVIFADGAVWVWTPGGVWKTQDDRVLKQDIQHAIRGAAMPITASLVNGVLDILKSEIHAQDHQFNRGNPETVNCLNGELELVAGRWELVPHRRENYRTTQIPVAFDPKAKAPVFEASLDQWFRDDPDRPEKIAALLELIGYTLMPHARHEKFVLVIGPGANGKSVLLAVLEALCGANNVAGVQPSNFDRSFQRAHLHQKLANIVTELKQGEVIADAELKAITSGEPSTVEHKYGHPFVMRPFSTCWFGTNHMPHTRDFSDALFRRAVILTFNRTFEAHEQDPQLRDKLMAELPGILNLTLTAYANALQVGFTSPASTIIAKQEWRLEADQVAQFVGDRCELGPDYMTGIDAVFTDYRSWADDQGINKVVGKKGLRERLTGLGYGNYRHGAGRYVTGLKIVRHQGR